MVELQLGLQSANDNDGVLYGHALRSELLFEAFVMVQRIVVEPVAVRSVKRM